MDGLEFTASLVASLAWPATIAVLGAFVLRSQQPAISRLLDRVKSVKAGPVEVDTLPGDATPEAKAALEHIGTADARIDWKGDARGSSPVTEGAPQEPDPAEVTMTRRELESILTQYGQAGWDIAQMRMFRNRPRPVIKWDDEGIPQLLVWTTRTADPL